MKDIIYVTGHKNPDSDSICAAYAYSEFKNKIGETKTVACRLGDVNQETQFILDYFDAGIVINAVPDKCVFKLSFTSYISADL